MQTIIAALISALITGIIGPILTLVIQKNLKETELPSASRNRLNRLRGEWQGYFTQIVLNQEVKLNIEVILKNCGKTIKGEAKLKGLENENICLILYNGIFDGNILKIEYKNHLSYIFQTGSVVMEMNAKGNLLRGKYVGYAPHEQQIIDGEVYFSKKDC